MRAGKSTLSEVCEEYGFKRIAFADQLKGLCSKLLGISIDELNKIKNNGDALSFSLSSQDAIDAISSETGINPEDVLKTCDGQVMKNARELLQFVGTELIRKHCPDWHIERTRNAIQPDGKYVIDDVRFQNEKAMVEDLGGRCWFIVRPSLSNISRHASENNIKWQDCWGNVIVNDIELPELRNRWRYMLDDYNANIIIRDDIIRSIMDSERAIDSDTIDVASLMLIPSLHYLSYKTPSLSASIEAAEMTSDSGKRHTLNLELSDGTEFETSNPLEIEDLKFDIVKSDLTIFNK